MAEIIQPTTTASGTVGNPIAQVGDILNAIFTNGFIVFVIIFIILCIGVAVFVILKMRKENELKEQDDRVYAQYKAHLRASIQNRLSEWVKKSYSMKNLFFFGIPIFHNEHSLKVVDLNNNLIGYYRGETITHKAETIYCLYKKKELIFFEKLFLVRTINSYNYQEKVPKLDEKGKEIKGQFEIVNKKVNFDKFYKFLPLEADYKNKKVLQIQCFGIEEDGYYFTPSYVTKDSQGLTMVADFRPEFRENLKDYSTDEQFKRLLRDSGQSVDGAVRTNPNVIANKHWIEKTEEEIRKDDDTPTRRDF